jgi:signal peptidase II
VNRRWLSFFGVALAGAVLDVATKSIVFSKFDPGETVRIVPGLLSIQLTVNPGIVWGLFPSAVWMVVSLAAAPAIAVVFLRRTPACRGETLCGALILAGTLGNGWDRLFLGHVRDWILVRPIPNFNLADAMLTTSVSVLFLLWILHDRRSVRDAGPAQAREPHDGGLGDVGRDHGPRP